MGAVADGDGVVGTADLDGRIIDGGWGGRRLSNKAPRYYVAALAGRARGQIGDRVRHVVLTGRVATRTVDRDQDNESHQERNRDEYDNPDHTGALPILFVTEPSITFRHRVHQRSEVRVLAVDCG